MPIKESSTQFAGLFSQAGYETFYTGKWHNDGWPWQRGFTTGAYICRGGPGGGGQARPTVTDFGGGKPRQIERFSTTLFTDAAVQFLDGPRPGDKPFLMFVSYTTPHDPWTPPGEYAVTYEPARIALPPNFMPRPMDSSRVFKWFTDWHGTNLRDEKLMPFPRTPDGVRDVRSRYYGTITHMDNEIGGILDALDRNQLTENTLVIFIADQGISLGAHGFSGKQTMYEEGIRLPMIVRYPKLRRGGPKNSNLVSLMDIFPTICEAAGIEVPDSVEGKSLLGLYRGKGNSNRDRVFAAFVSPRRHRLDVRCIRTERYKLIHHLTTNEVELYDLQKDPYELENLAGRQEYSPLREELAAGLLAWRARVEKK
jgi:arylsulfatase A-like enzyme